MESTREVLSPLAAQSIADIKKQSPFQSQFTHDQIRRQLLRNVEGFEVMEARARKSGKKVGGYTLEEITTLKEHYQKLAQS